MANELTILIDADTSGLRQGLEQAENQVRSFQDRIQGIADVGQKLAGLGAVMTAGLTVPIVALGKSALQSYGEIQSLQKGLEAVMGSASGASAEFNKLKEVAKLPGLGMKEAVQGSINLQAIGINADKSRDILQQFGNAVATVGKGRVEFERAIYGVQQLANTDFPLGEDLNIIKDALPQVSNLLKEAFGTSRSDELQKLGVSSQRVLDTILQGLGKLPRVSGGIKGAFENLSDAMQTSLGRIGKIIDDNLNISGIIDKITEGVDNVITAFEGLNPTLQKVILAVAGVVAVAGPLLLAVGGFMALLPTLTAGITAIGTAFTILTGPIGLVTVGILGIVTAVVANWSKIRPYLDETIERFKRLYEESFIFRTIIQGLGVAFESQFKIGIESLKLFYNNFKTVGKAILDIFSSVGDVIEGTLTFDFEKIAQGVTKGFTSINRGILGLGKNSINSVGNISNIISETMDKWKNMSLSDFKIPKIFGDEVQKNTEKGVVNGLNNGISKKKVNVSKIEIPELTPINTQKKGFLDVFGNEFKSVNDFLASEAARSYMILNTQLPLAFTDGFAKVQEALKSAKLKEAIEELNKDLSNVLNQDVTQGITDAFSAIGSALTTGGNLFKSLGTSLLNSFGKILSDLGKQMIQYGVSLLALKIAMKSLNPYVAIAAGAALVAIGAGVSAFAQKQNENIGGSGSTTSTAQSVPNYTSTSYTSGGSGSNEVFFRISGPDLIGAFNRNVSAQDRVTAG